MSKSPLFTPEDDRKLIEKYKQTGELAYIGTLFKNYMHLVYGVCLKYLKHREESQDAVMQIFEKLIEKLKHHEVEYFKSWLYVLTKNHCLMKLRSGEFRDTTHVQNLYDTDMEKSAWMHHNSESLLEEDLLALEECINKLQNEQKQCIQLFYLESKSYKEITLITRFDFNKVKSYIQNGRRNLKICLDKKRE